MNRKEEIRKELTEISPFLAGLNLQSAFKVPKGYFKELPDTILEGISPLSELKKAPGFSVPKNYFESLPDLVLDRVAPKQVTETVSESAPATSSPNWIDDLINSVAVLFQPRYALRLASLAVLLIAGFVFLQKPSTDDPVSGQVAAIEIGTFEGLDISVDDLSDEDIEVLLDDIFADPNSITDEDLEGLL